MPDSRKQIRARYPKKWRKASAYCLDLVDHECVVCHGRANLVHHAFFTYDICGWSIFPLCNSCHKLAHNPQNWVNNEIEIFERNTKEFLSFLRAKYYYVYCKKRGIKHFNLNS